MPLLLYDLKHDIVTVVTNDRQHSLSRTKGSCACHLVVYMGSHLFVSLPHRIKLELHVLAMEEVSDEELVSYDRIPGHNLRHWPLHLRGKGKALMND